MFTIVLAVMLATAMSSLAYSQDFSTPKLVKKNPRLGTQKPNGPIQWPECTCRTKEGEFRKVGDVICLRVGGREFLAQCDMSQNVTTWREIGKSCPSASSKPWTTVADLRTPSE